MPLKCPLKAFQLQFQWHIYMASKASQLSVSILNTEAFKGYENACQLNTLLHSC